MNKYLKLTPEFNARNIDFKYIRYKYLAEREIGIERETEKKIRGNCQKSRCHG